jgi:hypothetical protein
VGRTTTEISQVTLLVSQTGPADDHVFLIGRPPLSEFLSFIRAMAVGGQTADRGQLTTEWRLANDHVKTLETQEAGIADYPHVDALDPALAGRAARFIAGPFFRKSFSIVPATLGIVELDRLVVFQKFIDLSFVATLMQRVGPNPSVDQLFDFCLPDQPAPPQVTVKQTAANSYTFLSASNDFRFLDAALLDPAQLVGYQPDGPAVAALALVVGYGSNFLNVASIENRLVLGNGSHRAYALRDLGVTHVPCIVQGVTRREELEILGFGDLQQNPDLYLKSARPPMLRDYFDPALRKIVSVARKQRALRRSFGVEPMDIPAT